MTEFWGEKKIVTWFDLAKGVGEVVFHSLFDQFRNPTPSEHFREPSKPNPIHLNRWEDNGWDDMGSYYDGDDPKVA